MEWRVLRAARLFAFLLLVFGWAGPVTAQDGFDPRRYPPRVAGGPTQILVLGTPHLSATQEGWDPALLEPLLERLAAFRPDLITIEALSGQAVSSLWNYRNVYGDTAQTYGGRIMMMAAAGSVGTGLGMAEAEAEARRLLRAWPAAPTPAQRRRLAALFAAAGDPYSALVQWWRLDSRERRPEDGINTALAGQLDDLGTRRNENHLIGSRLAARLGLERVHPIDSQDDDTLTPEQMEIFARDIFQPMGERLRADARFRPLMEAAERLRTPDELMATYRMLNRPDTGQANADLEWLPMMDRATPGDVGRVRLAGWEVRNLRMAANIRQASAAAPGGRVLVIVGSGHKPWFDAYLAMMADVQLVDAQAVLR
jgi:hypothetical protein